MPDGFSLGTSTGHNVRYESQEWQNSDRRQEIAHRFSFHILDTTTQDAYLVLAAVHGERNDYAAEVKDLDAFLRLEPSGPGNDNVRGIRSAAEGLATHLAQKP